MRKRWRNTPAVENVFVLGTGRCGTVTFIEASSHLDNFTASHESLAQFIGVQRHAYPPHHIEADNRLTWFLGELGRRFDDQSTLYVHLVRDRALVAASFERRWDSPYRASAIRAFGHGLVTRRDDWTPEDIGKVCEFYVDTVNSNIAEFLSARRSIYIELERIGEQFPAFVDRIGGEGDRAAILAELDVHHNAS